MDMFRDSEEAFKQLDGKIGRVDSMAEAALKNVDKDYVTVLQTKLVVKVKYIVFCISCKCYFCGFA